MSNKINRLNISIEKNKINQSKWQMLVGRDNLNISKILQDLKEGNNNQSGDYEPQ